MKRIWIAITAAYISLLPQFYLQFNANNRYDMQWSHSDHGAVVAAVFLLGCAFWLGYQLAGRLTNKHAAFRRAFDVLVGVALVTIVLRTIVSLMDRSGFLATSPGLNFLESSLTKVLLYMMIPAVAAFLYPRKTRAFLRTIYLIVSPAAIYGLLAPVTYPAHNVEYLPPEWPVTEVVAESQPANVFIFIFDAWSYERTMTDGSVRPEMPALKKFTESSTVYHSAYSPGKYTWTSVPRFLLQNNDTFMAMSDHDVMEYLFSGKNVVGPTIFADAIRSHFRITLGFAMNYTGLVGHQADVALLVRHAEAKPRFVPHVLRLLGSQLVFLRVIGLDTQKVFHLKLLSEVEICINSLRETHQMVKSVVEEVEEPIFMVAHYRLPKDPFVWGRGGVRDRFPDKPFVDFTVENYTSNLVFLDEVLDEIVTVLQSAGKLENSLVIFTSDHTWRADPEGPFADSEEVQLAKQNRWAEAIHHEADPLHPWKHVPLFIKKPGQAAGEVESETVFTTGLYPVIQSSLSTNTLP